MILQIKQVKEDLILHPYLAKKKIKNNANLKF